MVQKYSQQNCWERFCYTLVKITTINIFLRSPMKIKICSVLVTISITLTIAEATEYPLDLTKSVPRCGSYIISESSTRENILKNCDIIDTHSGMVRLFRGSETIDLMTTNQGVINCKFKRSAINSNGEIKECTTTTPQTTAESAATIIISKESSPMLSESH